MITGQKMQDIAQLTRIIDNSEVKRYVVSHWEEIKEKSREKDDRWADKLINIILDEDIEKIRKLLK